MKLAFDFKVYKHQETILEKKHEWVEKLQSLNL